VHAELTIEAGREIGRVFVVRIGQQFVLGRGGDVAIPLDDERISRRHALVDMRKDGLYVADLGSRNGTFLASRPVKANTPTLTAPGDLLELGGHRLRIELAGLDEKTRRERARTQRLDEPLLPKEEFDILGEIGRGATGRVYAARQKLLDRVVAVKVLRTDVDDDAEGRERFLREGRVTVKVQSPFVVEVYDVRVMHGKVYLVMELINGPSAKDRLASGTLPIAEVLKIGEETARALEAAHAKGVIHRDIKPANILLAPNGPSKLSDFGIAKELDSLESLTSTGEGLGTLAYVSPEQAQEAKKVGPRTDIYSLGATLYHLIAGRPPFTPANAKVLLEILDKPPPLLMQYRSDCPPELAALVHRMLAKVPEDRPPSAAYCAERLAEMRKKHTPPITDRGALGKTADMSESTGF
jgi:serine/threonine protein kinase